MSPTKNVFKYALTQSWLPWTLLAGYLTALCLVTWPGLYSHDALVYAVSFSTSQNQACYPTWESPFYCYYLKFFFSKKFLFAFVALFQFLVAVLLTGFIFKLLQSISARLAVATLVGFLLFPFNSLFLFFLERDVLFSWLIFFPSFVLLAFSYLKKPLPRAYLFACCLLLFFAALLRKDGLVPPFIFCVQLAMLKMLSPKKAALIAIIYSLLFFSLAQMPSQDIRRYFSTNSYYTLSATIKNVYFINQQRGDTIDKLEREKISSFFKEKNFAAPDNTFSLAPLRSDLTAQEIDDFNQYALGLIFRFPHFYLKDRLNIFLYSFNELFYNTQSNSFSKQDINEPAMQPMVLLSIQAEGLEVKTPSIIPRLRNLVNKKNNVQNKFVQGIKPYLIAGQMHMAIGVFIVSLLISLLNRSHLMFFVAGLPVLIHLLIFVLLAPHLFQKYLYCIYLYVFFVVPLFVFTLYKQVYQIKIAEKSI